MIGGMRAIERGRGGMRERESGTGRASGERGTRKGIRGTQSERSEGREEGEGQERAGISRQRFSSC